jgi:hypothetical protein
VQPRRAVFNRFERVGNDRQWLELDADRLASVFRKIPALRHDADHWLPDITYFAARKR